MHKPNNLLTILLVLLLCGGSFSADHEIGPYLQNPQPDGITIVWETGSAAVGSVVYGLTADSLNFTAVEQTPTQLHQIQITGLRSGQTYFYQCRWNQSRSAIYHFKTAPADPHVPIRVAVIGDSRGNPSLLSQLVQQILPHQPDILVHTGDFVVDGRIVAQWKPQFFEPMQPLLATTPVYVVPGNHENEAAFYYDHFPLHRQKPFWSAIYGSIFFVGLNTNVDGSPSSEQYLWLRDELASARNHAWRIALLHHPLFHVHPTRDVYDIRYYWQPLFIEHGVHFAFSGHDHYYLRNFPIGNMSDNQQGVIHITSAGGGAPLYSMIPKPYAAYYRSIYHFLILDIDPDQIVGYAINEKGICFDSFIFHRQQSISPPNFVEYEQFELEQRIQSAMGNITPTQNRNGQLTFDTNVVLKTNFNHPVTGYYQWDAPANWSFRAPQKTALTVNVGEAIVVAVQAAVPAAQMYPAPTLQLHLEAKVNEPHIGFRNQDLQVNLEQAWRSRALRSTVDDLAPAFAYLNYFSAAKTAMQVQQQLAQLAMTESGHAVVHQVQQFLAEHPSPENRYRFYPFEFLRGDFSHWDSWLAARRELKDHDVEIPNRFLEKIATHAALKTKIVQNWWLMGPFDNRDNRGLATVFPPEKKIDLSQSLMTGNNQPTRWKRGTTDERGYLDLLLQLAAGEQVVAYAYTTVTASRNGSAVLLLGSDDGAAVWVNRTEVFRKEIARTARPAQEVIIVEFKKGANELLVKVSQGSGDWGLYLQVIDKEGIITATN